MTDRVILRGVDGTTFSAMAAGELGYVKGSNVLTLGGLHGLPATIADANVAGETAARVAADTAEAAARTAADNAITASLAPVATSGAYADLTGAPTPDGTTITLSGGVLASTVIATPVTKTGTTYTVVAADRALTLNPSGAFTLTLPSASAISGRVLRLRLISAHAVNSASANVAPIDTATPGTAIFTGTAGQWCELHSDGTNWITMAGN